MAAGPLTSIVAVKEYEETYLPLFLWEFTFTDGTWAGFCTHGLLPAEGGFTYQGRNYEGLVLNGDVAAAQAMSSSGITMFPSLQLELDDADRVLTTNVEIEGPGFKGAQVVLRFLFYDPTATSAANAFSTDDFPLFLGSCITSPAITDATIRLTIQSLLQMSQGTLPIIHVQKRCPWIHPDTPKEKAEANKYESWFFNCGDTSTAAGHDHCDLTPSDCKRLGMWNPTTGILRFGGVEAELPPTWTGRPFGGDTETRDNAKNHTLDSEYVPHIYGRGWTEPIVINLSGEANYTRMQLLVCYGQTMAAIGQSKYSNSWKLSVNDIVVQEIAGQILITAQVPINGFWSFVTTGARDGALCNQVGYQVSDGHGGLTGGGDPFGSMTVLYASVLRRVTESSQIPTVQLLADGGMIPVFNSDDPTDFTLKQTKNPVWQAIDMMMWGGRSYSDMRLSTFRAIAALADEQITASDRNGVSGTRPRFESSIICRHPRSIGDLLQGVLGSFGGYLVTTDKIELHMYQTLCSEQPTPVPGSNDNTAYSTAGVIGGFNGRTARGDGGTGYVAYSFDSSNIKEVNGHTSLTRMSVSIGDEPNTFSYTFQDSQNEYQLDTLTIPDVDAIDRNSGQQIVATAPFEGITTYDQAFRMGRRSIAIRTRGNPVGDPRGTWRMSMTASVKAVSLRLGHLVLVTAQEFGLNKQLFRIQAIKPSLNFQEADLVMSWHEDAFYMDDYGVSGFPPLSGSRQESNRLPRTWQPFHKAIPATDPLYNGDPSYTFAMRQWLRDEEALTDSMIRIQGYLPITLTAAMDIQPPWFTDQDLVAETGGTLMPDQLYYVCIAVDDGLGKLSSPSTTRRIHIPPTGGNKQFRIQNLFWRGGGDAYVFVGLYPERLSFYKRVLGQPGTIIVGDAAVPRSSWGPPDSKAHHFVVRWRESIHAGVYGGAIAQVMPGGTSLKISGAKFAVNEWANRVMSVIGDANAPSTGDYFGVIDCKIASNTADTLVLSGSGDLGALGVQAGDAIVIRTVANIVSSTTIGDSKFVNSMASGGMGDEVIGREVVILWGTGMGQGRTITAHTGTTLTVSQAWSIMPDAASVFVIEEIGWQTQETKPIEASSRPPVTPAVETVTITDIAVQNWAARTIRVEVNLSDSVGKVAADALSREIYLYATFEAPDIIIPTWMPNELGPVPADPLYPDLLERTFDVWQDYKIARDGTWEAAVFVSGEMCINQFFPGQQPRIVSAVLAAGGNLNGPQLVYIAITQRTDTTFLPLAPSNLEEIWIPAGVTNQKITLTVSNSPDSGQPWDLWAGTDRRAMAWQSSGTNVQPSTDFLGPIHNMTKSLPETSARKVAIAAKHVWHSGVAGVSVTGVTAPNKIQANDFIRTGTDGGGPLDNWVDCMLTALADQSDGSAPLWNFVVTAFDHASGTFTVIPDCVRATPEDSVQVGDVLIVRSFGVDSTSTTVRDPMWNNFVARNQFNSPGLEPGKEVGRICRIIRGTAAGQWRYITGNTADTLTVTPAWDVIPDLNSVVIIEAPDWTYQTESSELDVPKEGTRIEIRMRVENLRNEVALVAGFLVDDQGRYSDESVAPMREIFIYAEPPGVRVIGPQSLDPATGLAWTVTQNDQTIRVDTSAIDDVTVQLLPLADYHGRTLYLSNDNGPHNAIVLTADGETLFDGNTSITIGPMETVRVTAG